MTQYFIHDNNRIEAQLIAARYLNDKQRERELKRMARDYYIMTGIALFYSVIAVIAWVRV